MILRDEWEVALNELIGLSIIAADTYETAARVVESHDGELAALFAEMAAARRSLAAELRALDRRLGDIPHATDPDYATLHDLFVRLKSLFAADERRSLIQECEAADTNLTNRLAAALTVTLPEPVSRTVKQSEYEVTASLGRLAAAKARL